MYSGKTTELIRRGSIYHELGLKVIYLNSAIDTRSANSFSTHNQTITKIPFHGVKVHDLDSEIVKEYDVVLIDEGQLFAGLVEFCTELCERQNKIVIVAGLSGDYRRHPFGEINDLMSRCDEVILLHAYCTFCKEKGVIRKGIFSKRVIQSDDQIVIGNKEVYRPACRSCFTE